MRRSFAIIIAVVFIFASAYLYAEEEASEEEASFVYRAEGRNDPFLPLVSKDGKLTVTYGVINSINDVILEGILYDPAGESVVVLNDIILKENDQVGRIKVKRIENNYVILIYENEEYTIKLKE